MSEGFENTIEFTDEMIERARQAASPEELATMAKEEGLSLPHEEAERYFAFLRANGELSDAALETVAGGKGKKKDPDPKLAQVRNSRTNQRYSRAEKSARLYCLHKSG